MFLVLVFVCLYVETKFVYEKKDFQKYMELCSILHMSVMRNSNIHLLEENLYWIHLFFYLVMHSSMYFFSFIAVELNLLIFFLWLSSLFPSLSLFFIFSLFLYFSSLALIPIPLYLLSFLFTLALFSISLSFSLLYFLSLPIFFFPCSHPYSPLLAFFSIHPGSLLYFPLFLSSLFSLSSSLFCIFFLSSLLSYSLLYFSLFPLLLSNFYLFLKHHTHTHTHTHSFVFFHNSILWKSQKLWLCHLLYRVNFCIFQWWFDLFSVCEIWYSRNYCSKEFKRYLFWTHFKKKGNKKKTW